MLTRNDQQEDLNFVFDHGNGFKVVPSTISTTVDLSFNSTTSPHDNDSDEGGHWMHTKSYVEATARAITKTTTMMTSSTTKIPPTTTATTRYTTRKYYSDTTGDPYGYRVRKYYNIHWISKGDSSSQHSSRTESYRVRFMLIDRCIVRCKS